MLRFLLTRVSLLVPTFFGMTLLAFFLIRLVPGDPIETMAGERGIDKARHEMLLKEYGLDRPVIVQYGIYIGRVLSGQSRQVDDHAGAGAEGILHAVPGHDRARQLCDPVRAAYRHSGGDAGRGAAQFDFRPRRDGRIAGRLLDADFLVGPAADSAVLGAARADAGVRAARRQVFHRAGDRFPVDRFAARGTTWALSDPRHCIWYCR